MGDTALVGRDAEWLTLVSALDRVERGTGAIVLVEGEPGIGKTRLVDELAREAAARELQEIRAICRELAQDLPFAAIADAVGRDGTQPDDRGELAALVRGEHSADTEGQHRARVLHALLEFLERQARVRGTLLVIMAVAALAD